MDYAFKCQLCNHTSQSMHSYVYHYKFHRNVPNLRFPCPFQHCMRTFATYTSFRSHILRDHKKGDKKAQVLYKDCSVTLQCTKIECGFNCDDLKEFIAHLKVHLHDKQEISCPFQSCEAKFTNKSTFTSHVSRKHKSYGIFKIANRHIQSLEPNATCSNSYDDQRCQIEVVGLDRAETESLEISDCFENDIDNSDNSSDFEDLFLKNLALFYLKMQAKYLLPATTIQTIIEEFQEIYHLGEEKTFRTLHEKLQQLDISGDTASDLIKELRNQNVLIACNKGPLRTDYTRKTFFKKTFNYISPVEVTVGTDEYQKKRTFQYVPIKESLKSFVDNFSQHITFEKVQETDEISDVCDGYVYKENKLFKETEKSLKIILYQDSFEVVNPLGSAKTKHKLLAVYYTLANIAPELRSNINHMQLVILCKEAHLKKEGSKIFELLVNDLKSLETCGVEVRGETICGAVACISGDNLGSHGIGGFMESFQAHYFCRYCTISREEFHNGHPYQLGEKRTIENFKMHLANLTQDEPSFGIKSDSCFNKLKYFHVCNPGLPPCLAHDLFEGVVSYDMALFIKYFVSHKRWFTYDQLNRRLSTFKFLGCDSKDKPCEVHPKKDKLSGHAVQNWVFLRVFPLIVGKYVEDVSDDVWGLFLTLKSIVELICAPKISVSQIAELKVHIEDYLNERKLQFEDIPLRPKHHFMAHYPELILALGPLIRIWTMRFEAKHSYFKRCARMLQNFKHIDKTLAERHQLLQAYFTAGSLFPENIIIEQGIPFSVDIYSQKILNAVNSYDFAPNDTIAAQAVILKGTEYKKDMFLILSQEDEGFILGKILLVLSRNLQVYFIVSPYQSNYSRTVGLHKLNEKSDSPLQCIKECDILDYFPLLAYNENGTLFISLKHSVFNCQL